MKFWETKLDALLEFGEELKRVYDRVMRGDVEFVPTVAGCHYCPIRKTPRGCAAYNRWFMLMLSGLCDPNEPVKLQDPDQMSRTLRYHLVKHIPAINNWLQSLKEASYNAAMAGDPDPGSKLVEGDQGNRYFTDAEAAKRILVGSLGRKAFKPRQLIGITEIERLLKPGRKKQGDPDAWEALLKLVDRPAGKPKLVPEEHSKPALAPVMDDFDDLD